MVYWLSFYPGVMSFDSISQWHQLSTLHINNWHPAISTILMWLLTRLWYSPAVVSLFQVIFAAIIIGYGLTSLYSGTRLPGFIFIVLGILISADPLVAIINVTLWKDVIYGFLVLLLSTFLFNIIRTKGEWIAKPVNFVLFGVTLAFIFLFRVNGFPVAIVSLICLLFLYTKYIKPFSFAALITIAIILVVVGPLYSIFKVDRSYRQTYGIPFLNPVAAYISTNQDLGSLSLSDREYLDSIYPLDNPWPYSCYDATIFFYESNLIPVVQNPLSTVKIFTKLATHDPSNAFRHFLCLSSFIWQPNQPLGVYLETILFENYNPEWMTDWSVYKDSLTQSSILPQIHNLVQRAVKAEVHRDTYMLFWRHALYLFAFLVGLILLVIRTRNARWLLLAVPIVSQSIIVMFTAQLQAVRYQYPVYLISLLFTLPMIIVALKNPKQLSN
ncbi:MAG: hypothetical protein C3F13_17390 [Anaerolineales bacterium]|nr:MAG: hypothetical protein C3F13_17390 [Anaerolineales bacterium]